MIAEGRRAGCSSARRFESARLLQTSAVSTPGRHLAHEDLLNLIARANSHKANSRRLPLVARRVCLLLKKYSMATGGADILFACTHCKAPLIVDAAAAGMTVTCQICASQTAVPTSSSLPIAANSQVDLQQQLKENESQRTEVTGHINQLNIQLHRWQLRLQTLNERKVELEAVLASAKNS